MMFSLRVLFAFTSKLGYCSMVHAKLWGILLGIHIAWSQGCTRFVVESDLQVVINLLRNGCARTHICYGLVHNILWSPSNRGSFSWSHAHREANQVAYALASFAQSFEDRLRIFDVVPSLIDLAVMTNVTFIEFPYNFF